jgi:proliferating cell nuclear antigen
MDGSKISLVYFKLNADGFEEYTCNGTYELGINVANLYKLLRSAGSHDSILLRYMKTDLHRLEITIQNFDKNSITRFDMKLIEIDSNYIEISDIDFDTIITMPSNYFQRMCRDMHDISNTLRIVSKDSKISFECDSDFASQKTFIGDTTDGRINITKGDDYDAKFSLKYLTNFCKASGLSQVVELFLKDGYPLVLKYSIGSLGTLKFVVSFTYD